MERYSHTFIAVLINFTKQMQSNLVSHHFSHNHGSLPDYVYQSVQSTRSGSAPDLDVVGVVEDNKGKFTTDTEWPKLKG